MVKNELKWKTIRSKWNKLWFSSGKYLIWHTQRRFAICSINCCPRMSIMVDELAKSIFGWRRGEDGKNTRPKRKNTYLLLICECVCVMKFRHTIKEVIPTTNKQLFPTLRRNSVLNSHMNTHLTCFFFTALVVACVTSFRCARVRTELLISHAFPAADYEINGNMHENSRRCRISMFKTSALILKMKIERERKTQVI